MSSFTEPAFVMAALPDSKDARLFVELSSYGADLHEAASALELELESRIEGSPLEIAQSHLLSAAVIAYARAFAISNVRPRLADHITVPPARLETHNQIIAFRNTTIAHSQSRLTTTYAIAVFDRSPLRLRDVSAPVVRNVVPPETVVAFKELISAVDELLWAQIEPVRQRLFERVLRSDFVSLLDSGGAATVVEKSAAEFTAQSKRDRYPSSHDVYWSQANMSEQGRPTEGNRTA